MKHTAYWKRMGELKGIPQISDKASRAISHDQEPSPSIAREIAATIAAATWEIDRRRKPT